MIGALGACFGRVVTLDSPRARPPGKFNWEATLWHELAHVITLQMSKQRVPRWLTEGISVYEEQRARPEWGREMEVEFAEAHGARRGREARRAERRRSAIPRRSRWRTTRRRSRRAHRRDLRRGRRCASWCARTATGIDTDAAIRRRSAADSPRCRRRSPRSSTTRFAPMRAALARARRRRAGRADARCRRCATLAAAHPGSYPRADGARRRRSQEPATRRRDAARSSAPRAGAACDRRREPAARWLAKLALGSGDTPRAVAALERLIARDCDNVEAARQLATLLDDPADAARAAARRRHASPNSIRSTPRRTRRSAGRRSPTATRTTAARWFRAALAAGPRDPAAAHTDLAESLPAAAAARARRRGRRSRRSRSRPTYARAQDLLLAIVDGAQVTRAARRSRSVAVGRRDARGRRASAGAGRRSQAQLATRAALRRPAVALRAHQVHREHVSPARYRRSTRASRGPSTARRPSRTCRAAIKTATAIEVEDPIVLTLDDPRLLAVPVDLLRRAGQPAADSDTEVPILREFLLRGGTRDVRRLPRPVRVGQPRARAEARVSRSRDRRGPKRRIRSSAASTSSTATRRCRASARSCTAARGRRAASSPHLRTILDDRGRPMVFINWNTDMGDGWEWSNAEEYPGLHPVHGARPIGWASTKSIYALTH